MTGDNPQASPCDDAEIMRLWRECGLPEHFLGNGGTNHKLVAFADRVRDGVLDEVAGYAETIAHKSDKPGLKTQLLKFAQLIRAMP